MALTCGLAQPCLGPTIAIRRQMLNRIGGLSRFVDFLGADYLIGQAVHSCGGKVAFAPITIECSCFERSGAELFVRPLATARRAHDQDHQAAKLFRNRRHASAAARVA